MSLGTLALIGICGLCRRAWSAGLDDLGDRTPAMYAVLIASGSAAVVLPVIQERRLRGEALLTVAAIGGPKRLSHDVLGVAGGFFVPLFFVVARGEGRPARPGRGSGIGRAGACAGRPDSCGPRARSG